MTLTYEQRKRLTEYLGECWHTFRSSNYLSFPDRCLDCDAYITSSSRRTFTTDADMMALYRAIYKKGKWSKFIIYTEKTYCFQLQLDSIRHNLHNFNAWLFCLDGKDYEARCCLVAEWLEVRK